MPRASGHAFALLLAGAGAAATIGAAGAIPGAAFADAQQFGDGSSSPAPEPEEPGTKCTLLATTFDYLAQGTLVVISFLSLLGKRWKETPKREFNVWFLDVVKQILSMTLAHFIGTECECFLHLRC